MSSFRNTLIAFILVTVVALVGRVIISFGLVAATVGTTLSASSAPWTSQQIASVMTGGVQDVARMLSPAAPSYRVISVLDAPAELERLRKARDARLGRSGPMIVQLGD
jgi:uncharacterized membrane protein